MKASEGLMLGGVGLLGYMLLSGKKEDATTPAAGGTNLSLGGLVPDISLPGIDITMPGGGGGDSGLGGIIGSLMDLIGKVSGGGGGGGVIEDILNIDTILKPFTDKIGDLTDKIGDFTGINTSLQDLIDKMTKDLRVEFGNDLNEKLKAVLDDAKKIEVPTPWGNKGPNNEFDLNEWFQNKYPFSRVEREWEAAKQVKPTVAKYDWGWSWLPDSVNTWLGNIAYSERSANIKQRILTNNEPGFEYSPYIQGLIDSPFYDPARKNLIPLMKAEKENYIVSQEGPRPGTEIIKGEWQEGLSGWSYYIPGF